MIGGGAIAPSFLDPASTSVDIVADNSVSTATFTFGGWIFPVDASPDRGHVKAAIRDAAGDTIFINDEYAATIDPPNYTMQSIVTSLSEPWDSGTSNFGSSNNCFNISNGARISKGAGVSATFTMDITIKINETATPDTCPGGGGVSGTTVWFKRYIITVTFTG